MKVKILEACYVDNKAVKVGDVIDTNSSSLLIGLGKAEKYKPEPEKKEVVEESAPVKKRGKK